MQAEPKKTSWGWGLAATLLTAAAFGQQSRPEFEVASIKPNVGVPARMSVDGARVAIRSESLQLLIQNAYRVQSYQVVIPAALNAGTFDILAKIPDGATAALVPQMLQTLLADRFKLVFHRASREMPVYALVVAKDGLKLKAALDRPEPAGRGVQDGQTGAGDPIRMSAADGILHFESHRMDMSGLAGMVNRFVDRPVVDQTRLTGYYQVAFDTALFGWLNGNGPVAQASGEGAPGPGLVFDSVQKLGLRLEAQSAG